MAPGHSAPLGSAPGFEPLSSDPLIFVLAGAALLVAMIARAQASGRLYSTSVVYLAFGVAVAAVVELLGVRWIDPLRDAGVIEHAAELAVIVALFATGLALERPFSWRSWGSTWRLLGIVMPLTMVAVTLWSHYAMGLSVAAAIVLAAALAPTDPVLADDLGVGPPGEPDDDEVRFALTSEAGFNDGLAFPFVMLGLLLAGETTSEQWLSPWLLGDVLWGIGVAVAVGVIIGLGLGRFYLKLRRRSHVESSADPWIAIAAVLAVYGITEVLDAYGFLAAFAGGLALSHARGVGEDDELTRRVHGGAESAVRVGELVLVMMIGTLVSTAGLLLPGVSGWAGVLLMIIVFRPLATVVALIGSPLSQRERWFVGWFGVRGIGSVYYAAYAAGAGILSDGEARTLLWTVLAATIASILLHGLTAEAALRRLRPQEAAR